MKLGETDLSLIRVPLRIRDLDGNPVAGVTAVGAQLKVSRTAPGLTNAAGSLVDVGGGFYYYQGVAADASVEGFLLVVVANPAYQTEVAWQPVLGTSGMLKFPFAVFAAGALLPGLGNCTGPTVAPSMTINGGAFGAVTGSIAEIGAGAYYYTHNALNQQGFVGIKLLSGSTTIDELLVFGELNGAVGSDVVVVVAPPDTTFFDLVARADRSAQAVLGGEQVIYRPLNGIPVAVTGIYDARFELDKGSAQAGVETSGPAVFFRLEDLPADPEYDEPTLTIRGLAYRVIERMPDGIGGIVLAVRLIT